jgi:hypothetical protein
MRAILLNRRGNVLIYTLQQGGSIDANEVRGFLSQTETRPIKGDVFGFIQLIDRILNGEWHRLTNEHKKSWDQDGTKFYELRKGKHRIGCFFEATGVTQRLLLMTCFRKSQRKESREYNRAVGLYVAFSKSPIWIDEG